MHLSLYKSQRDILASLDSNARYWILNAIYHARTEGKHLGAAQTEEYWRKAAAEKRIKTRKMQDGHIRVRIQS